MDKVSLLLWGICIFLLTILIGIIVNRTDHFLAENFGSQCLDYLPFKTYKNYSIKPDTIFVSIASYRDEECSSTLESLYKNAAYPKRVYVGICEQNKKDSPKERCMNANIPPYLSKNVRLINLDYLKAKGPTYARYYCAELWRGEQYFLQIDSHTTFVKNWDLDLIEMIKQIKDDPEESSKPVLSSYPPTKEQMEIKGFPEMDNGNINELGIPSFLCGWSSESDKPRRSNKPWAAAGFMFLESNFLYEVPYDPNLSHLFQLEETLFSARLWTNGWDFYVPNKKVCYHHYNRTKAPLYHQDLTNSAECRSMAEKRGLFLLGLGQKTSVSDNFLRDHNYYGLGKFRKISDFWKTSGIDFETKTVERWNDHAEPSDKYKGWYFRRDGFQKIKKYYN